MSTLLISLAIKNTFFIAKRLIARNVRILTVTQIARQVNAGGGSGHDRVQVVAALMAIDAGLERLRHAVLEKGADDDR